MRQCWILLRAVLLQQAFTSCCRSINLTEASLPSWDWSKNTDSAAVVQQPKRLHYYYRIYHRHKSNNKAATIFSPEQQIDPQNRYLLFWMLLTQLSTKASIASSRGSSTPNTNLARASLDLACHADSYLLNRAVCRQNRGMKSQYRDWIERYGVTN